MSDRFGEELSLDEVLAVILTEEAIAEIRLMKSTPEQNFGPELSLNEVMDLLYESSLPPRARFWEDNDRIVQEAIHNFDTELAIGVYQFKIEYVAIIRSMRRFDTMTPRGRFTFYPNGKGQDDPDSVDRNSGTTGSPGDAEV